MLTGARNGGLGKADRFHINPRLRDEEWNRAKQPHWLLTVVTIVVTGAAFLVGVYGTGPSRPLGWAVGAVMLIVYMILDRRRRGWARRYLRRLHGQAAP